ncbi:MAG: 4-hydroxy-tetrahydrodipicolinate synthase [Lachnospiraceae bacterium]|nr:4-hydroxy-tetrahydrodipicolinate synthase [Lachnospiraceae bacterium]
MAIFKGSGVALVTPMKDNLQVDYDKLEELVEFHISNDTDAIIIVGTTGEGSTLSMEEHRKTIKACVEFVKGRIPVVAGTGSNNTKTAIQHAKEAEEDGADAALIVTPYYNKATQAGLIKHYSMIADETKLPIILYNVPSRTGTNIAPETVAHLIKTKSNIVGLKEATGNMAQAAKTVALCDGNIELYSGEDGLVVPLMSIGAIGVISVIANIAPRQTHDMVIDYLEGSGDIALKAQLKALPLIDALFSEVNPIPVKKALNLMGKNVGSLRPPLCEMSEENAKILEQAMKDYGLL